MVLARYWIVNVIPRTAVIAPAARRAIWRLDHPGATAVRSGPMTIKRALRLVLSVGAIAVAAACQQSGGPLTVDKIDPPQGTTAGGEEVTILGGGFQPGKTQAEVRFGRKKSEVVTIASNGKIKVVTPVGDKGPVDVSVSFDDGRLFKLSNGFRYMEPAENQNARNAFFQGGKGPAAGKIELEKK